MRPRSVSVRVPATTANLGPGFDCLGMALDWWNDVHVEVSSEPRVVALGEGADSLSSSEDNLVYRAAQALFREAGEEPPHLSVTCENRIPLARGLGSSAAALVGGLVAANALCERPLDEPCLLQLAARMEGHADNVAPALLGGCRVVVRNGDSIVADAVSTPPELKAIVLVPDVPMPTRQARAVLSPDVTREDAVFNLGRVALLVNALAQGRTENLRVAAQDRLHQPARAGIFPAMKYVIRAAESAGALCAFLSGGGSSVLALAASRFMTIGFEMADAADKLGYQATVRITSPSALGAHVVDCN
ncbi:MAG: homoserine kinase [Chloroflexota bacterium]|nr:homoserine kinase [Chloroflexota bacterium]MDE2941686.1 homoserine kinase [Chloroflexota bacterium]MDE3267137.1 homoserine kinase [Chloroflexota bacterium]